MATRNKLVAQQIKKKIKTYSELLPPRYKGCKAKYYDTIISKFIEM